MNNEMGDFNAGPGITNDRGLIGTEPNLARPQQRMLSSMTPTILAKDGELVAVTGSPGGRTIINTVLQVTLNVMEFGMGIQDAVDAKRIHHQWLPDAMRDPGDGPICHDRCRDRNARWRAGQEGRRQRCCGLLKRAPATGSASPSGRIG